MLGGRIRKFAGLVFLLALFAAVFYVSWNYFKPKEQAGTFGAIALSEDSGIYGTAFGYRDAASAVQRSVAECAKSGGKACIVKASLNGNCGTLVVSPQARASFVVTDADKYQASAFGLAQCLAAGASDCTVREQICGKAS